ncbi:DUF6957 family protein [Pseudomonas graminis]|uniref:DUF6957 domain-containing protein n=1 Tax=Pseudomonas graminis TaxID=158627 RepID=A0A1C2EF05_9PSED|nr:hypothetical protein [Pseudomonas graminis]OCX25496.1 hypothetical protein BBI10_02060 [Pseudomonas graminis]
MSDIHEQVAELFRLDGARIPGFNGDEAKAEAEAILSCRGRRYCVVRDWIIVDVDVPADYRVALTEEGLEPFVLYAEDRVLHSGGTWRKRGYVRTTFSTSKPEPHVFRTRDMTFVLMGQGCRKTASLEVVMAIANRRLV